VKYAVQKYGMDGITVRNLSDACGVNDSHLHRFFTNKDELLLKAYQRESDTIFKNLLHNLDETKGIPLDFRSRVRLHFHRTWADLISDPARLAFCVYYSHSSQFCLTEEFHKKQVETLGNRLQDYFKDRQTCVRAMYSLLMFLYDNAKFFIDSGNTDVAGYEEEEFNLYYALLSSFFSDRN